METIFKNTDLNKNLNNSTPQRPKRIIPPLVVSRAKSAGVNGEKWLVELDNIISELEDMWDISVGNALSGGTHAFVAYADGRNGEKYVLKVNMPEDLGGEFSNSIETLKMVDGHGYAKLYAYDLERKACLLERLGKPLNQLNYSVFEQIHIVCDALQKSWKIPVINTMLPRGMESVVWFRNFIREEWEKLKRPCSHKVIEQAFSYLQSREDTIDPTEFVLLHGDAHAGNALIKLSGDGFKLIDPDGIFYEKAYDLGVLMREWVDEYEHEPLKKGKERCKYLHRLTGVSEKAIWEWGFLQTVSTAFVLLQIGQEETGLKMLRVAECWTDESTVKESKYMNELIHFLSAEYGLDVKSLLPAKRGFYGETWDIQTEKGKYFVKIDYWNHHKESYQNSLPIVQYMTNSGISFIPKIINTKNGNLYCNFRQGTVAVFEYISGDLSECYSVKQLYNCLAKIYMLKTNGIKLKTETFDAEPIEIFHKLQKIPELPADVKKTLSEREPAISEYAERLKQFAAACKNNKENFHITHGDAGGNCILNGNQLFLIDWDSVMLAPIERDVWIYICDQQQLDNINSVLIKNGIRYTFEKNRLCYYCYAFFFYYLNEYLKSVLSTKDKELKAEITKSLIAYLTDNWIYQRLAAADFIEPKCKD